eukprot:scaffold56577_cov37-Tisochrysis_lutea.AAC.3
MSRLRLRHLFHHHRECLQGDSHVAFKLNLDSVPPPTFCGLYTGHLADPKQMMKRPCILSIVGAYRLHQRAHLGQARDQRGARVSRGQPCGRRLLSAGALTHNAMCS